MYWLRQAVLISFKDTTQWRRDIWGFVLTLGFPMAFATAFFFFLTPVFEEVAQDSGPPIVTVTTQETSDTALSHLIIAWMSSDQDPERPAVEYVEFDSAVRDLADGELQGFIAFPEDFTDGVTTGRGSEITVHTTGDPEADALLVAVAGSVANEFGQQAVVLSALNELSGGASMQAVDLDETGNTGPQFFVTSVGNVKPTNAANVTVPGYLVMFVFMSAAFTALTLAVERESGTLERLANVGCGHVGDGLRKIPFVCLPRCYTGGDTGAVRYAHIWHDPGRNARRDRCGRIADGPGIVRLWSDACFNIPHRTRRRRRAAVLVSLVAAPLGGSWWPLFILSDWMRALALLTPHGWANTAFNRLMLFGGDLESVAFEMLALAGFAVGFIAVAVWRFRVSLQ